MNEICKTILERRSIRLFKQEKIEKNLLEEIVTMGLYAPSRQNKQPLKFVVVNESDLTKEVFKTICWGSKVPAYKVFADIERAPSAFIVVLVDKTISQAGFEYEMGAAIQNMLLTATSNGIGSVWIKSIDKIKLGNLLELEEHLMIDSLIALGVPDQTAKIIDVEDNNYATQIDENLNMVVPKRKKSESIIWNKYTEKVEK